MSVYAEYMRLFEVAQEQGGVVTRPQLARLNIKDSAVREMLKVPHGLERLGRGVYGVPVFLNESVFDTSYMLFQQIEPGLFTWEKSDPVDAAQYGVLSYFSAAELHGCMTLPLEQHVTVPAPRPMPAGVHVHVEPLGVRDVSVVEGLPVTSMERTTRDLGSLRMDGEHRARWMDFLVCEKGWSIEKVFHLAGERAVQESERYMEAAA